MRQGRLTPEEAIEHPQRSVITRALGPEHTVEVDTRSFRARAGDVYLVCSDGLTTMLDEDEIAALLRERADLREAGEALIAAANAAGGRDNITVVLARLEEVQAAGAPDAPAAGPPTTEQAAVAGAPAATVAPTAADPVAEAPVQRREPRRPGAAPGAGPDHARRRRRRIAGTVAVLAVVLGLLGAGAYLPTQSVYFVGTDSRGLVTIYRGLPYELPAGIALYSASYTSGVAASTVPAGRRHRLLDHSWRSHGDAQSLIRSLELGQLE
jgi:protein phosphatase